MASYRLTDPNGQNFDAVTAIAPDQSALKKIGNFKGTGSEIAAYDAASKQLFVVSGTASLQVLDISNPTSPKLVRELDMSPYGGLANSVAIRDGLVAIAVEAKTKTDPGKVVFFNAAGTFQGSVNVGALPDMLTFSPDGKTVLVANEGEPNSYRQTGSVDPVGSVSLIDVSKGVAAATVRTAGFEGFNSAIEDLRAKGVRIYGPNATVAQDLEPEYITVSADNKTAWVSLQENNAIAIIDLVSGKVTDIKSLGLKDFSKPGNGLDPSDRDGGIKISNQPVFGLYQPDAIASLAANGQTYILTANEGDARDYTGFTEEIRVGNRDYRLDAAKFPTATLLKTDANLGRLTVSSASGDTDKDGDFDRIETFGARSFSVRDAQGNLVFDSGSQLERIIAAATPTFFNADSGDITRVDTRSDNKGPEPEGLALGTVGDRTYAFVGLERGGGGVMVYEVTNPTKPVFIEYVMVPGDVGPEGIMFISGDTSPNGKSLLVVSNEVSFTTAIFEFAPPTRISDIQGATDRSPLEGKTVSNVAGIVTAVRSNGFYLQDPNPDANAATSEAVFVFTSTRPTVQVGDSVLTNGIVGEFRPGTNALSTTQIGGSGRPAATFTVLSSGNALPDATVLGQGGRIAPTQSIADGIRFYESLEGMRLQVNNAQVVGATNNFGEIWVVADNGQNATGLNDRGGITISKTDFNPERIQIDDDLLSSNRSPNSNVGDRITSVVGVLDYNFSNYELLATTPFSVKAGTLKPEVTSLIGTSNQLTVATFNVENLDPKKEDIAKVTGRSSSNVDDDIADGRFTAIAQQIINNLKAPDIVALQEIQDSDGAEISTVVDAKLTAQTLIDAIISAGGPRYEYRDLAPVYGQDGGQPGGNIRPGFLFNPDRVNFREGSLLRLTDNNLLDGDAFANSRKPLVGEFIFNGQTVTIVNNHFNSKGGDQALFGANQPPILTSEVQRLQQATIVNQYVTGLLNQNSNSNVMVVGDLNDFQFSKPLEIVAGNVLTNLAATKLPAADQYTYVFEGNSQMLDHILVSNTLKNAEVDIVHINAEFANAVTDHDPTIARLSLNRAVNTIVGTNANDNLYGDGKSRVFYGLDGDDNISSNGGESIQFGGRGNDALYGQANNDYLDGGDGNDRLYGNGGNDVFVGGRGNDELYGNGGNDLLDGGDGDDILYGNGGNDRFFGGNGNDKLFGNGGNDYFDGGDGDDLFYGNGGNDTVFAGSGKDIIYLGGGRNTIDSGAGDDTIWLNGGNDTIALSRGNGRDTINNFQAGRTKFTLSAGLSFGDLSFTASNGGTLIQAGTEVLASLSWASTSSVNRGVNFM